MSDSLSSQAIAIWSAGVAAVDPYRLVEQSLGVRGSDLYIANQAIPLEPVSRIVVIGAGKAVDGMTAAALDRLAATSITIEGRVNGIDVDPLPYPAIAPFRTAVRKPGQNEPTPEAVLATDAILQLVADLGPNDLAICLLSGGGSAMLSAPPEGVTLEEKLAVIRHLIDSAADIHELNAVRRCLSRVKGGALARQCNAGQLHTLLLSDVLGDPLETIASGPTVPGSANATLALDVLNRHSGSSWQPPPSVIKHLRREFASDTLTTEVHNHVIGNLELAMQAAADHAAALGFATQILPIEAEQPTADEAGRQLAEALLQCDTNAGTCIISGGEPTVELADAAVRGKGGRNQQLALAALDRLAKETQPALDFALLSAGTDGEDGPTDAAGAILNKLLVQQSREEQDLVKQHLANNDAYRYFASRNALFQPGPTGTNVCDLRVLVV